MYDEGLVHDLVAVGEVGGRQAGVVPGGVGGGRYGAPHSSSASTTWRPNKQFNLATSAAGVGFRPK
jgi:hypothetical protein